MAHYERLETALALARDNPGQQRDLNYRDDEHHWEYHRCEKCSEITCCIFENNNKTNEELACGFCQMHKERCPLLNFGTVELYSALPLTTHKTLQKTENGDAFEPSERQANFPSTSSHLLILPTEILTHICMFLHVRYISRLGATNSHLHEVCHQPSMWLNLLELYQRRTGFPANLPQFGYRGHSQPGGLLKHTFVRNYILYYKKMCYECSTSMGKMHDVFGVYLCDPCLQAHDDTYGLIPFSSAVLDMCLETSWLLSSIVNYRNGKADEHQQGDLGHVAEAANYVIRSCGGGRMLLRSDLNAAVTARKEQEALKSEQLSEQPENKKRRSRRPPQQH